MSLNYQQILNDVIEEVKANEQGSVADYIPELAQVDPGEIGIAIRTKDNQVIYAGDPLAHKITLQSAAKLVVLIGLLEEFGAQKVFSWVRVEPSGDDFNSVARLDQFGPLPSNPMLNAGAIALCSHIPGNSEEQLAWLERWMEKCFGESLTIDPKVLASERRTGDRNRALAFLMKATNVLSSEVKDVLEAYFCLCSFQVSVEQASYLPWLLANGGVNPEGEQVISKETVHKVLSVMATCGLYNESGTHFMKTGLPAKSSVSGYILATAVGKMGIAAYSPRVNKKGTSIRSEMALELLSERLSLHFAD